MACNCCLQLVRHIKESRPSQMLSGGVERNQEQHILKTPMNDIVLRNASFLDRLWRDFSNFSNHVAIPGEICVKSPAVMKGYHKNPEETAKVFTVEGYFKPGELGYYKPDKQE